MTNPSATSGSKKCVPCEQGAAKLKFEQLLHLLKGLEGWALTETDPPELVRSFKLKNDLQTLAFVSAIGWMAHTQDHHPDVRFGYNTCEVRYHTHSVGGITENDFICAVKVNELFAALG